MEFSKQFLQEVDAGRVSGVKIKSQNIRGRSLWVTTYESTLECDGKLYKVTQYDISDSNEYKKSDYKNVLEGCTYYEIS